MNAVSNPTNLPVEAFDLSAFVRGLTHEVANPLNAIAMNCELLRMIAGRGEPERVVEAVERILIACSRSGGMMRGLQRFGSALRRQPAVTVGMRELIDGAVQALATEYPDARPRVELSGVDASVHVDRAGFERTLVALLRNAAEAGSSQVLIEVIRDAGDLVVDLRDDGAGFLVEDRDKYASPFYSTHRTPANMGLGLTLVREILRAHGGSLRIMPVERGAHLQLRVPAGD